MFIDETEAPDIDREDIAAERDELTLATWFTQCKDVALRIKDFIEAYRFAGLDKGDWYEAAASKMAFLSIGARMIEQRMQELGYPVPYPPHDPRTKHIRMLEEKIKKQARVLKANGLEVEA